MLERDRKLMARWQANREFGRLLVVCRSPDEFVPVLRFLCDCMPRSRRESALQYVAGRWG